jgi:hypothetical protein
VSLGARKRSPEGRVHIWLEPSSFDDDDDHSGLQSVVHARAQIVGSFTSCSPKCIIIERCFFNELLLCMEKTMITLKKQFEYATFAEQMTYIHNLPTDMQYI